MRFLRFGFVDDDFGAVLRFLGACLGAAEACGWGEVSREPRPPRPAASRNSSRRSASPASLILRLLAMVCTGKVDHREHGKKIKFQI